MSEQHPDNSEPTHVRQAELRASYEANLEAGNPPYKGVHIRTLGEIQWIMQQRGWSGELNTSKNHLTDFRYADFHGAVLCGVHLMGADLRGAMFSNAELSGDVLWSALKESKVAHIGLVTPADIVRADMSVTTFEAANLTGAHLEWACLSGATLFQVDLSGARLDAVDLESANLREANLSRAALALANCENASLRWANLSAADLSLSNVGSADMTGARMDSATQLVVTKFNERTKLGDITWNDTPLTRIEWANIRTVGEEVVARSRKVVPSARASLARRLLEFQTAVRANRQLATALRRQGLNDDADRFAYRAQLCHREALRCQGITKWPAYLGSLMLWALSGYGYRIWRIFVAYALVLLTFATIFFVLGIPKDPTTSIYGHAFNALLVSLTAIHGRVFFEQFNFTAQAWVAAVESVIGIVIEGVFVAMLIQRWFQR